jgi:DNA adenine methylase
VSVGLPARFDITQLGAVLEAAHERLAAAVIERLPFADLIARYDRADTLFYLDPPYYGCERDYGPGVFDRADFERMAAQLAGIRGRFLLSLNDTPEVRKIFRRFQIEAINTTYSIANAPGARGKRGEVLISG